MKSYAESPLHGAVSVLGKMVCIPDSCVTMVECCDCGKKTMSAHCTWKINRETLNHTGPHCGCRGNG